MKLNSKIMEEEVWKDIVGYEGLYQVSDMGRVRSLNYRRTRMVKVLKGGISAGYPSLLLYKEGKPKMATKHSLVAKAFLDADYLKKGLVVNHKDFNKKNNILSNLEVITERENSNKKHILSTSQHTGVSLDRGRWKSTIVIGRKLLYLGKFDTEIEASEYYAAALVCVNEGRLEDIVTKVKEPKGYSFQKGSKKWVAYIWENGKHIHLGSFKTAQEAQKAYLEYKFQENN